MADAPGGAADFVRRLRALLPRRWFADEAPVLGAVLAGLGDGWARVYAQLAEVRGAARLSTALGQTLDLIARDFFGTTLVRQPGEADGVYRARIGAELLRERATRAGLARVLTDLTGRPPRIFEPARPADTGGWGVAAGYNAGGGWGSLQLPFQCFVTAYRPREGGIGAVGGYGALRADGLIAAGAVSARSTPASYFDRARVLRTAAPGEVRIDWTTGTPLVLAEAAGANQIRNPRAEGALIGTGLAPTFWFIPTGTGLSRTIVGVGSESGIPYVDIRISGTASAAGAVAIQMEQATQIAAAVGQAWALSAFVRLVGGSLAGVGELRLQINENNAAGNFTAGSFSALLVGAGALAGQRRATARVLTGPATVFVQPLVNLTVAAGAVLDFTLRIGAPQMEQRAGPSSVMLPPVGSPGVAVRDADAIGLAASAAGGWGAGALEYASPAMIGGRVTDRAIMEAIARTMPAASIAWTAISS